MQRWLNSQLKETLNCSLQDHSIFHPFLSISPGHFNAFWSQICLYYEGSKQQDLFPGLEGACLHNPWPSCGSPRLQVALLQPSLPLAVNWTHSARMGPKTFTTAAQHNQDPWKKPRLFSSAGIMEELQLHPRIPVSWPSSQPVDTCLWVQMLSLPSAFFRFRKSNSGNLFFSTVLAQCAK